MKWCQDRAFLEIILYILKQYKRRGEWLARIKRDDLRPEKWEYVRVCSDHFVSGMPVKLYDSNNPDWAPSLKLGYNKTGTQAECSLGRYERAIQRNTTKRPAPADIGLEEDIIHGTPVQTELTSQQVSELQESVTLLQKEKSYPVSEVESVQMNVKGECKKEIDS